RSVQSDDLLRTLALCNECGPERAVEPATRNLLRLHHPGTSQWPAGQHQRAVLPKLAHSYRCRDRWTVEHGLRWGMRLCPDQQDMGGGRAVELHAPTNATRRHWGHEQWRLSRWGT